MKDNSHTSTMTSKGQVTIPAKARKMLGLKQGREFTVKFNASGVTFVPMSGWNDFLESTRDFGEKARVMEAKGEKKPLLTNDDIARAAEEGRRRGY